MFSLEREFAECASLWVVWILVVTDRISSSDCGRKLVMTGQFSVDQILYQALHNLAKEELSCSQCGRCAAYCRCTADTEINLLR